MEKEKYADIYAIHSPNDIKNKTIKELNSLSNEIREFIIDKVSQNGGHLSPNLGTVEVITAMHYVFNAPKDKLIFDVGHQAYTHKILTGRAKDFDNLRKMDGASGFLKYNESEYDSFEAGHSSTSISALCGFLEDKKIHPDDIGEVVAFIGDGSLQNGLALSAINYLSSSKQKGIIIINDNEMSISPNVGGFAKYFNKLRIKKSFSFVRKLTTVNFRATLKSIIYRNVNLFSTLRYTYLGPVDGHDFNELIKYLTYAKNTTSSIIIHVKTIKGKGYEYAEKDKTGKYHGIGPFNKLTGEPLKQLKENEITFSRCIGDNLIKILQSHPEIKIISPAMIYGSGLCELQQKYPEQIVDVGIAEENAVIMASAMSLGKSIPIVCTYSTFFQRAYDELNHDISRCNAHAIFLSDRAGLVPNDGNTHQGIFDIPMMMTLPNFVISCPATYNEAYDLINEAIKYNGPTFIRYPKTIINKTIDFGKTEFGKWKIINPISDKNIIAYGPNVIEFYNMLKGTNIGLINALFVKPYDLEMLKQLSNKEIYVYEDVYLENSLSSKIIEASYLYNLNIKIKRYGLNGFVETGTLSELRDKYNLNIQKIVKEIIGD